MITKIYDYLHSHKWAMWSSLAAITLLFATLVLNLSYKEDISDFLPLGENEKEAMKVYQDISGANRMFVMFENPDDADRTVEAINLFTETVQERDTAGWCADLTATFDMERLAEVSDFVYQNIPYFLTAADYRRMDSLLADPQFVDNQLEADREMLMFPSGNLLSQNIGRDPLNLFTPVVSRLQKSQQQLRFEMYDGYIFTPDMSRAVVMMTSPFGNSETSMNSRLLALLDGSIETMNATYPDVKAHVVGGPQIAVGNASQIKYDSILAVALSLILIVLLLAKSFSSVRNIALIGLSISWGWLFALGGMSLFHDSVSIIVIGISSVILGIAVNYPLHLVAHVDHQPNIRSAIGEIVTPLLVGNVTTVGAFLALVPLQSTALRDLGLFASLLLIGTMLFVLLYLPHFIKTRKKDRVEAIAQSTTEEPSPSHKNKVNFIQRLSNIQLETNRYVVMAVLILTAIFGYFSTQTEFDSNMSNINYMTDEQRADMAYFQQLLEKSGQQNKTLYVVSSAENYDAALELSASRQTAIDSLVQEGFVESHDGVCDFISSQANQQKRLQQWNDFLKRNEQSFSRLATVASSHGFSQDAFSDFADITTTEYHPQAFEYFSPLTSMVFSGNFSTDDETSRHSVVDVLHVKKELAEEVTSKLPNTFDIGTLNSALANSLSDDFNYIGWACSLIVFFFLWFSFRRIELAIISFIPMAVSWVWIMGIMGLLGIKFNIVNIILATFIFGQGDDYTIFMTEGCISEYIHKKPVLSSYKNSIILSALIMFVGIGTLIVAKHPAMHSLAEVTIVGMFCVVLMAYLIPPLLFKWLMKVWPERMNTL